MGLKIRRAEGHKIHGSLIIFETAFVHTSLDGGDACVRLENVAQAEQEDGRGMARLSSSDP